MKPAHLHWLLELMVVNPVPLGWILPSFNRQHTNALPIPNFKSESYSELIISALREGSIAMESSNRSLNRDEAMAAFAAVEKLGVEKPANPLLLRLTKGGGLAWESLAHPNWDKFLKLELTYVSSDLNDLRVSGRVAVDDQDVVPGSERLMGGW
jgi:hypothetical protein